MHRIPRSTYCDNQSVYIVLLTVRPYGGGRDRRRIRRRDDKPYQNVLPVPTWGGRDRRRLGRREIKTNHHPMRTSQLVRLAALGPPLGREAFEIPIYVRMCGPMSPPR